MRDSAYISPRDEVQRGEAVVLIPSRNRPESLTRCHQSILDTSDACTFVFIDADQTELYRPLFDRQRIQFMIGKRNGPVSAVNAMCHYARPAGPWRDFFPNARAWVYSTDDSTIGPPGWDKWLIKTIDSLPNRIGVISAEHAAADYVNFPAMSTEMVEATGWFALPNVTNWVWDTALELIGDATRIVYAKSNEMSFVHRQEVMADQFNIPKEDCWNFVLWCVGERKRIIERVRRAMEAQHAGVEN
jgi:hypothetical protein